jgi:hypothetical protein
MAPDVSARTVFFTSRFSYAQDSLQFFEQADSSIAREYGGSGLCLAITCRLVKWLDIRSGLRAASNGDPQGAILRGQCLRASSWSWLCNRLSMRLSGQSEMHLPAPGRPKTRNAGIRIEVHPGRPRDLALAGAQPRKGSRLRGDGPHHGHPRDLPPQRALARRARAGGDRAPRLHGAAPARGGQARRAAGAPAQRHRRARCRRIAHRAGPAQDPRPHRRAATGNRRHGRRAQDAARAAPGRQGSPAWRWSATPTPASPR